MNDHECGNCKDLEAENKRLKRLLSDIDYIREKVKQFDVEKEKLDSLMSMGR